MPFALIAAVLASLGIHGVVLFVPEVDLSPHPEPVTLQAEIVLKPRAVPVQQPAAAPHPAPARKPLPPRAKAARPTDVPARCRRRGRGKPDAGLAWCCGGVACRAAARRTGVAAPGRSCSPFCAAIRRRSSVVRCSRGNCAITAIASRASWKPSGSPHCCARRGWKARAAGASSLPGWHRRASFPGGWGRRGRAD